MPRKRTGYVVANPRGVPKGVPVLRAGANEWGEGDAITEADLSKGEWKHYSEIGLIVGAGSAVKGEDDG